MESFDLINGTEHEIPAGTRVWWMGSPDPPTPKHQRTIEFYDPRGQVAAAGWALPEVDADTLLECELTACEDTVLEE